MFGAHLVHDAQMFGGELARPAPVAEDWAAADGGDGGVAGALSVSPRFAASPGGAQSVSTLQSSHAGGSQLTVSPRVRRVSLGERLMFDMDPAAASQFGLGDGGSRSTAPTSARPHSASAAMMHGGVGRAAHDRSVPYAVSERKRRAETRSSRGVALDAKALMHGLPAQAPGVRQSAMRRVFRG